VKITGAHDFNDYKVARAHDLPLYILMDSAKGRMANAEHVPAKYRGLDRFEARKRVVEDIEALGLLDRIENKKIMQPFGDRSNVVIEPMLTDQWYVNAGELAKAAISAVETGKTKFVPESVDEDLLPVDAQHRAVVRFAPALVGAPDSGVVRAGWHVFVEESEAAAQSAAKKHYGKDVALRQDEDVLDTWFSSALWPFSTLGWPENTSELKRFYPTSTLVTAHDIIFFWVARMMMMGMHFMKEVPFKERLHPRAGPRREGPEDVEVQGQRRWTRWS
jgi:valyl-tRNA synthetase